MPFKKKSDMGTEEQKPVVFSSPQEEHALDNLDVQVEASGIDSSESANTVADLVDAVNAKLRQDVADSSMGSVAAEEYSKASRGINVTPSSDSKAYQGQLTPRQREDLIRRLQTRTATDEDMANIDESMLLELPFIKAADFSIPGQFSPKPKDPSIRFRWVNRVNAVQSNMMRLMALGFQTAGIDDVDTDKTPLHPSMLEGTEIRNYDVVLMKISVLQLMALYKKNVVDSLYKLDAVNNGSIPQAAAVQSFTNDLGHNRMDAAAYVQARIKAGKEPVTFSKT